MYICVYINYVWYVYCPYNEFKNKYLNYEIYYSNLKINISVMKRIYV